MTFARFIGSPKSYAFSLLMLLANLGVYLVQIASGVSPFDPTSESLIAWGGDLAPLTLTGDYWRLATSLFLHAGLLHLAANMYMLIIVGPLTERRFGTPGMVVIYLGGGLFASFISAWWRGLHMLKTGAAFTPFGIVDVPQIELVVAIGASGALMAICGALLASVSAPRLSTGTHDDDDNLKKNLIQVIVLNIVLGFSVSGIDQAAHLGGLIAGYILALAVGTPKTDDPSSSRPIRLAVSSLAALGILWFLLHNSANEGLQKVRDQIQAEQNDVRQAEAERQAKSKALLAAEKETAALPVAVSDEMAGGRVLNLGASASAMALSHDEKTAYVTDYQKNRIYTVDLESGKTTGEIVGPQFGTSKRNCGDYASLFMCDGQGAANIVLLPERNLALVPSMVRDALAVVDLQSGKVMRSIPLGRFPRAIVVSKNHKRGYVQSVLSNTVAVVDLDDWKVLKTWQLSRKADHKRPDRPLAMWFSGDGKRIFVANGPDHQVEIFDTESLENVGYEIPSVWFNLVEPHADDKDAVYGLSAYRLFTVANEKLNIRKSWDFCNFLPMSFTTRRQPDGRHLLAVHGSDQVTVHILNMDSSVTLGAYPVPGTPRQMQFSADGKKLFVLGQGGTLSILDPRQRMAIASDQDVLCKSE